MEIRASDRATDWIRARGGCVYLWNETFHGDWMLDRVATDPPPGREFDVHYLGRFASVAIDVETEPPKSLDIRCKYWPFRGLKIFWNRKPWGERGKG